MKRTILILTLSLFSILELFSQQNVAINTDGSAPDSNAILDIKSFDRGILIPRMTTLQRQAILDPTAGLMVYDTDIKSFFYHPGINGVWKNMLANLELPYFEGISINNAAFHLQNSQPSVNAIAGKFTAADGIGVDGMGGNTGGKFWGGTTGIDVVGGTGGRFSGTIGLEVAGTGGKAIIVEQGKTGLGTTNPQARLHVYEPGASGQTPLFRVTRMEAGQPELGLTFQLEQQYADMPEVAYGNLGMMSNTRLNFMTNNDLINPAISILANKVGINKSDGIFPFSINGKTGIYEGNTFMGEIFGNSTSNNLHINVRLLASDQANISKNLILQTPLSNSFQPGFVGINNLSPVAFLDVSKGNDSSYTIAKFGQSVFGMDLNNTTSINGGSIESGFLALNDAVPAPVFIGGGGGSVSIAGGGGDVFLAGGGGDVIMADLGTKLSIGTVNTTHRLNVNGTIRSTELIIESGWADYVFDKEYQLMPIEEVEKFILYNKHLPNIPSAEYIQKEGLKVAEVTTLMMEKIEEMMLYIIEQNTQIKNLKNEVDILKNQK